MNVRFCLPIMKTTQGGVLDTIDRNVSAYDFFEVWIDYIIDFDATFLRKLERELKESLVLVFRRRNFEEPQLDLEHRLQLLSHSEGSDALIDLDIERQKTELEYVRQNQLKIPLIVSYHNYETTPEDDALREIITAMDAYQPYIFKIATQCAVPQDALRLLQLLVQLKDEGKRCIILGMGEHGAATRVFGTLWGNDMIFAPQSTREESAPGQLTRDQLKIIFKELER